LISEMLGQGTICSSIDRELETIDNQENITEAIMAANARN